MAPAPAEQEGEAPAGASPSLNGQIHDYRRFSFTTVLDKSIVLMYTIEDEGHPGRFPC